jgi:hypothetical protein
MGTRNAAKIGASFEYEYPKLRLRLQGQVVARRDAPIGASRWGNGKVRTVLVVI